MNRACIVGRITKDIEIKLTPNQVQYCNFTVAVDRRFKDANGQRQADFINCVAWKQTATFIQKYFRKGSRIGIVGSIQTRSYEDQNGQKHFVTEVLAEEAEFVESNNNANAGNQNQQVQAAAPVQNQGEQVQGEPSLPFEI